MEKLIIKDNDVGDYQRPSQALTDTLELEIYHEIICQICKSIYINPVTCTSCKNNMCSSCVSKELKCPQCFGTNFEKESKMLTILLQTIQFQQCPFKVHGCNETEVKYSHISTCKYQKEQAQKGICEKCYLVIFVKDKLLHQKTDCPYFIVTCDICKSNYNRLRKEEHAQSPECLKFQHDKIIQFTTKEKADYNVIFVGDSGVGKSSIQNTYITGNFNPLMKPTLDFDIQFKKILKNDEIKTIALWDIAGSDSFHTFNRKYYKNKDAAILVFDITDEISFQNLDFWIKELQQYSHPTLPVLILLGNKTDLQSERRIAHEKIQLFIEKHNISYYFEVSAKNPITVIESIDKCFEYFEETVIQCIIQTEGNEQIDMPSNANLLFNSFGSSSQLPMSVYSSDVMRPSITNSVALSTTFNDKTPIQTKKSMNYSVRANKLMSSSTCCSSEFAIMGSSKKKNHAKSKSIMNIEQVNHNDGIKEKKCLIF